jgi:hypothetical protein
MLLCSYPHSLHFLELLQSKDFRTALALKGVQVMPVNHGLS